MLCSQFLRTGLIVFIFLIVYICTFSVFINVIPTSAERCSCKAPAIRNDPVAVVSPPPIAEEEEVNLENESLYILLKKFIIQQLKKEEEEEEEKIKCSESSIPL